MRKRFTKPILVGTLAVVVSAIVAGPAFGRFVSNSGLPPTQHAQQSKTVAAYEYPNLRGVENLLTPAERRQLEAVAAAARNIDVKGSTSFVPGYTDFPNVLRLHNSLTATERRQLDSAATNIVEQQRASALGVHQPGVTSGAAALPPEVIKTVQNARASFVPGYSDFPNALRLHSTLTPTERRQLDAAVASSNSKASFVPGYTDFPNVLRRQGQLTATERRQLDAAVAASTTVSSSGSGFSWSDASVGMGIGLAIAAGLGLAAFVGIRRNKATPIPA
jgi:hypothetical protein